MSNLDFRSKKINPEPLYALRTWNSLSMNLQLTEHIANSHYFWWIQKMVVVKRLQRTAIVCYVLRREKNFRYFGTWIKCLTTNLFLTTSVEVNMDCFEIKLKIWSIYYTSTVQYRLFTHILLLQSMITMYVSTNGDISKRIP